ncbi:hypothetical protein PDO_2976 [Rhizobium sp. PDO1-076]|uniref:hypothetical protein n=1 Tax=Rhizobium sp. PDO1-076 TaxID=1125979 RepID=UPI00024E2D93|nr:hypothetical protein [Rhizobium sp. PDO1-076]EHS49769.1 hypothetical protein PDO_2976 [Rhizobium sp. PDO1-076]
MTATPAFTIRAYEGLKLAEMIRLGEGQMHLCEMEPKPVFVVTAQGPDAAEEVIGTFPSLEAAQDAARALEAQMRAELGTDGAGLKLATVGGRTLQ